MGASSSALRARRVKEGRREASTRVHGSQISYWRRSAKNKDAAWTLTVTTVDNGGEPFRVELSCKEPGTLFGAKGAGKATIFARVDEYDENDVDKSWYKEWGTIEFERAFVAVDAPNELVSTAVPHDVGGFEDESISSSTPSGKQPRRQGGPSKRSLERARDETKRRLWYAGGHAVLLKINGVDGTTRASSPRAERRGSAHDGNDRSSNEYIYIGDGIYAFTAPEQDEIHYFDSVMGASATPDPFALGRTHVYAFAGEAELFIIPLATAFRAVFLEAADDDGVAASPNGANPCHGIPQAPGSRLSFLDGDPSVRRQRRRVEMKTLQPRLLG